MCSEYVIARSSNRVGDCGVITKVYHNFVRANRTLTRSRLVPVQIRPGGPVVQENFFPAHDLADAAGGGGLGSADGESSSMNKTRFQVTFEDGRRKNKFTVAQLRRAQPVRISSSLIPL